MKKSLFVFLLALPACIEPVDEADDLPGPGEQANYAPEDPHEPPEGYCQPFTTSFDVYSPWELELDLQYCYDSSDLRAHLYVHDHGGISCGQLAHRPATYTNQTWHCGSRWYVWVPY